MEMNWHNGWNDDNCDHSDRGRFVCKKSSKIGISIVRYYNELCTFFAFNCS